jgi:hypothetical protein
MKVGESRIGESAVGVENWHPLKQEAVLPKPEKINQAVSFDEFLYTAKFGKEVANNEGIDALLKNLNKENVQNLLFEAYKKYDEFYDKRNESPEASDALDQMEGLIDVLRKKKEQPETNQETQAETQVEKVLEKPAEKPEVVLSPEEENSQRDEVQKISEVSDVLMKKILFTGENSFTGESTLGEIRSALENLSKIRDSLRGSKTNIHRNALIESANKIGGAIYNLKENMEGYINKSQTPRNDLSTELNFWNTAYSEVKTFIKETPVLSAVKERIPSPLDVTPPQARESETKTGTAS